MNAPLDVGAALLGAGAGAIAGAGLWMLFWLRARLRCDLLESTLHSVYVKIQMARDCDVAWLDLALEEIDRVVPPQGDRAYGARVERGHAVRKGRTP